MKDLLRECWDDLVSSTDGWPWYWVSCGEKCYCFGVVTAYPYSESEESPPAGTRLEMHPIKENLWVGENNTAMLIDQWLVTIEEQNGDAICRFIAQAFADAQSKYQGENINA